MARMAVVYYSSGGTIERLAEAVASGAADSGSQVRMCRLGETPRSYGAAGYVLDDLEWADAIAFGTPACFGNVAAPVKELIDSTVPLWREGKLADKVVAGFTAAASPHGGHETTLLALYQSIYHWGSVIVPMGYTDPSVRGAGGNPYGVSAQTHQDGTVDPPVLDAAYFLGRRVSGYANRLRAAPPAVAIR